MHSSLPHVNFVPCNRPARVASDMVVRRRSRAARAMLMTTPTCAKSSGASQAHDLTVPGAEVVAEPALSTGLSAKAEHWCWRPARRARGGSGVGFPRTHRRTTVTNKRHSALAPDVTEEASPPQPLIGDGTPPKRRPRMARPADPASSTENSSLPAVPSKLDRIAAMLCSPEGATIAELMATTGWQAHSVRGAIAGALKKRGLVITSESVGQIRRYHAQQAI